MKVLKKVIGFIALFLIVGGAFVLFWLYFRNKQIFAILAADSVVRGSLPVIQKMGLAVIAIIAGLMMFVVYMKVASVVRRNEREKRAALREAQRENEEVQKQLRKEAEDAKAEAEKAKKENELMKMTFMRKKEEPESEEAAEEKTEEVKEEQL